MTSTNLFDSLRQLKRQAEETSRQIGPWRKAIESLFGDIESWLAPAVSDNLLSLEHLGTSCADDGATYEVPMLRLRLPDGRTIEIQPVGLVLGAGPAGRMGRIDIEGGAHRARLLWTADGWKIARASQSSARAWDLTAVTAESFLALLNEFVPGSAANSAP